MKSFFGLFLFTCILAGSANSQTLFTYGTKAVSKNEFLKAYNKNNTSDKPDENSLKEYLDLYSRFKLKVQAAYDLRMDTLATQKAELQSFRSQIIQTYLNDDNSLNELVNEANARSQKDIRLSHIFIPARSDSPALAQKASRQIEEAYKQLQQGKDFGEVALLFSADSSVKKNNGDLGFITVFLLPYELENLAYKTPLGKFSPVFHSKAGYHIFKKTDERKALGKIKVGQILLTYPPDADEKVMNSVKLSADSIYGALLKGADFPTLVELYSGDNFSLQMKGEIPEFGVGRYSMEFENAAFELKKDGDISKPLRTDYGFHIIKRLSRTEIGSDINAEQKEQLRQQVMNDDRMEVSKRLMTQKILKTIGYKKAVFDANQLWAYSDSTLNDKPVPAKTTIRPNTLLFSFAKQNITVKDWLAFRRSVNEVDRIIVGKTQPQLLEYYTELAALEYYKKHLEEFNPEFAFQLKEFKDGNLLFEIMQTRIWDKASSDSVGLKKYFNAHKNNYWWENSLSGILFTAANQAIATKVRERLRDSIANWRQIIESFEGNVIADSGRFEVDQLSFPEDYTIKLNTFSPSLKNQVDTTISFIYIQNHYPERSQRNFEDARGYVINDYQVYLEEAWINQLKKKYPIKMNEAIVKSLTK